jgi:alkaline phosphatase
VADQAPRNVIFLVGDGMGYHQIDAASLYQHGTARNQVSVDPDTGRVERLPGRASQVYESFPLRLAAATYQHGHHYDPELAWGSFGWVRTTPPDSAATATALATGVRTYNAAIGVDPDGEPVGNLTERARELGKSAGVVSSDHRSRCSRSRISCSRHTAQRASLTRPAQFAHTSHSAVMRRLLS